MNKMITTFAISVISLSAFAELDPMGKYGYSDEVMRGTDFPVQDITLMKVDPISKQRVLYPKDILEKGIKVCKENNRFRAYKTERKHPNNRTELSEVRGTICAAFEVQLKQMNR
ncbi:hypothetical protein [Pasteurella multocida]|uniref:hypothetical protein n=1 Tax=Pasteurella multocida TaxID=747 RepID=UPI0023017B4E|nr:hypothetical protein [Pasteurella multocida]MDA5614071.1 hypothetical protein [Pasteurella multocida]